MLCLGALEDIVLVAASIRLGWQVVAGVPVVSILDELVLKFAGGLELLGRLPQILSLLLLPCDLRELDAGGPIVPVASNFYRSGRRRAVRECDGYCIRHVG